MNTGIAEPTTVILGDQPSQAPDDPVTSYYDRHLGRPDISGLCLALCILIALGAAVAAMMG